MKGALQVGKQPFKFSDKSHVQDDALIDRPDTLSLCSGIGSAEWSWGPLVRTSGDLLGGRAWGAHVKNSFFQYEPKLLNLA